MYLPGPFMASVTASSHRLVSSHSLLSIGGGRVGAESAGACEQPNLWTCCKCHAIWSAPCQSHRSWACGPCARRYKADVRKVAQLGLVRCRADAVIVFVTLTAPSLPHCKRRDHHGCKASGRSCKRCECSVDDFDVAEWNAGHTRRKNDYITAGRRGEWCIGRESPDEVHYFGGVEPQDGKRSGRHGRYALHDHLILVFPAGVRISPAAMKRVAMRLGFGHSIDVKVLPAYAEEAKSRIAAYAGKVAHYVSKAADEHANVPWPKDPTQPKGFARGYCWRPWTASRGWACSMAEVRRARRWRCEPLVAPALPVRTAGGGALDVLTGSYARHDAPGGPEPPPLTLFDPGGRSGVIV